MPAVRESNKKTDENTILEFCKKKIIRSASFALAQTEDRSKATGRMEKGMMRKTFEKYITLLEEY